MTLALALLPIWRLGGLIIISDHWLYLSPAATNSSNVPSTEVIVKRVVCLSTSPTGSRGPGVGPTPDYIVVGGFFTHSHSKPTEEEIWTNQNSGSKADGAIWSIFNFGMILTGAHPAR
ncbi:hypothetical protein K443DRAFT_123590 [Laccaria amethystina LaAM-08-1]|uniref:Unplaced genomic scaffold K443scaffold_131, whole genome shotgun sequence n=1 Tax=Laccaria amethystina LaAM-08-1 TaxID=1095629 RepID=A0A0C9XRK8_9AGAR|nr:hypothetical protein K443DRAFT_123590 [Laccaria amethystina LaAM-08-1]